MLRSIEIDFLEKVNFEIKQTDVNLERMLEVRNNFLKNKFTELFFERIRFLSVEKNLPNNTLHHLATYLYEKKKKAELSTLEWAVNTFGDQNKK